MIGKYWKQFKSGSDIRGIASDNVKGEIINLTNDAIEKLTLGFAIWLAETSKLDFKAMTISVGHDSRISADRIKSIIINTLRSIGVNIYDCGLSSTPSMFMTISSLSCIGAIQITASHHPSNRNGLKFFTSDGGLNPENIDRILEIAQDNKFPPVSKKGNVRAIKAIDYYCEKLRNLIKDGIKSKTNFDKPLSGYKIIVDAGNGAGGFFANDVLAPLGANIEGSIFLEPDGNFPNHIPNPENDIAMEFISKAVIDSNANLGIIFDTDVDRAAFVDSNGQVINRNKLIALASAIVLEKHPNSTIVTDSVTSDYLTEFIENMGGKQFRFKRGYRNVIQAAQNLNNSGVDCQLAIESSGHAALKENGFLDDGAYLAAKIIIQMVNMKNKNKSLEGMLDNLVEAKEHLEIRIPITDKKVLSYSNKIFSKLKLHVNTLKSCEIDNNNLEGVRIKFRARWQEGWCLLRKSVHDPIIVINIESYVNNGLVGILKTLKPFLENFPGIDLSNLNEYINSHKINI